MRLSARNGASRYPLGTNRSTFPAQRYLLTLFPLVLLWAACAPASAPAGSSASPRPTPTAPVPVSSRAAKRSPKKPVVVAAAGDISCSGSPCDGQKRTSAEIIGLHPDAVLALGDLQYPSGKLSDFRASYDPTWGRFKRITHPAPGNHEYETANAGGYFAYFGKRAHPPWGYYSFNLGAWHIVSLNATCPPVDCVRERRWLKHDLRHDGHVCQLAYWHQPRWSSGPHGSDPLYSGFWQTLYNAGADVVLNGHDHDYERFTKLDPSGHFSGRGIREFVVGTGGISHYAFGPPVQGSQVRIQDTFGILRLALSRGSYGWKFIDTNGKTLDSGTNSCHR